ncbi:MAG: saccharopine dehydrogenase C-terminal domain-containing protein [Ginsengibacter sp.]
MKKILLFGAGKSASILIDYLVDASEKNGWEFIVCDADISVAKSKIGKSENVKAVAADVTNETERQILIREASIVISLLPPSLHFLVAKDCVQFNKNLLTASYVDEQITSLKNDIEEKGLLFLCEMGLDPGIDHMSAIKMIHTIKNKNGRILSFKSHCGGLIAPESDNNPWHYKISWNSRNIVLAGKDGATYRKKNKIVRLPYQSVFRNCNEVNIPGTDTMVWYPNRDSLHYINIYDLNDTPTFIRTTLRYPAFCRGWNKVVTIGLSSTDDYDQIKNCKTFDEWYHVKINPFTQSNKDWNNYLQMYITDVYKGEFSAQVNFLELNHKEKLPENFTCSADILQFAMEKNMSLSREDHDMIVMYHEIEYEVTEPAGIPSKHVVNSALIVKGDDQIKTAMAKTVGLPLAIATKLILQNKILLKGLLIPTHPEIYEPVLKELEELGIKFNETTQPVV